LEDLPVPALIALLTATEADLRSALDGAAPAVAVAVDEAASRVAAGGRIRYVGAGTSGRIGVLDAAELPPTFGVSPYLVTARIAGGDSALRLAIEGAEDLAELGRHDVADMASGDVVIALTASGRTPYASGALECARDAGAYAVLLTTTPESPLERLASLTIGAYVGTEILPGSTRLKAGTAQKILLNAFSTATMVRLGYTYRSRMIGVAATNTKLRERAAAIVAELTGHDIETSRRALIDSDWNARVAVVLLTAGVDAAGAARALAAADGRIEDAVRAAAP
jgi:N-acetylmuramic acid 6-phosphate etherase